MNLNDYKGILVFAEQRDGVLQNVGLELVGKAKELAKSLDVPVTAALIGYNVGKLADTLGEYGADKVIVVDQPKLELYDTEAYAQVFKAIIDAKKPEIVLFGATGNIGAYFTDYCKKHLDAEKYEAPCGLFCRESGFWIL